MEEFGRRGLSTRVLQNDCQTRPHKSLQRRALGLIKEQGCKLTYKLNHRIREKLLALRVFRPTEAMARAVCRSLDLLSKRVPPRLHILYIRTLFNGWCTTRRTRFCQNQPGNYGECVLGCADGEDSLQQYFFCPTFLSWLHSPKPLGLGLDSRFRGPTVFLLIADFMTPEDKLKVLCGLAALYTFRNKTIHAAKKRPPGFKFDVALHLLVRHCARGSPLTHLLATG